MRAIVTGGAGFVGTNLIKKLVEDGHEVVCLDNFSTGLRQNQLPGCQYFNVDIRDLEVNDISGYMNNPDVIFHLAALARIQPSLKNPKPALETNVMGTLNILEWARMNKVQVVYAGSSTRHHGIHKSPYAWSKYGGEQLCELYSKVYDLNTCICRFYNVYGDYHIRTGDYATVVGIFEQQYMDNESLTITGNGEQRRDFTHVDDICRALIRCVGKNFRAEEFELGRGKNYSINEIANMFGDDYPQTYIPARPGEYPETLMTDKNAKDKLSWRATKNIEDYITKWLEENKNV
jgi:UDP-glucose 4-epimerase